MAPKGEAAGAGRVFARGRCGAGSRRLSSKEKEHATKMVQEQRGPTLSERRNSSENLECREKPCTSRRARGDLGDGRSYCQ